MTYKLVGYGFFMGPYDRLAIAKQNFEFWKKSIHGLRIEPF